MGLPKHVSNHTIHTATINMSLHVDAKNVYTTLTAVLTDDMHTPAVIGCGVAHRAPGDPHVGTAGYTLALGRALRDLSDQLEVAGHIAGGSTIEVVEDTP